MDLAFRELFLPTRMKAYMGVPTRCSIPRFRLTSTPIQYGKVRHTSSSCVLLSLVTINVRYNEIYLQYVFYNLLIHILISYHLSYVLVTVLCTRKQVNRQIFHNFSATLQHCHQVYLYPHSSSRDSVLRECD